MSRRVLRKNDAFEDQLFLNGVFKKLIEFTPEKSLEGFFRDGLFFINIDFT